MKTNKKSLIAAASINAALTILYILALIMMGKKLKFTFGGGDNPVIINFKHLNATRIINWLILFAASLYITVCLYGNFFRNLMVKVSATAAATVLAVLEFLTFLLPIIKKMISQYSPVWDFMSTVNLVLFFLRLFVAVVCIRKLLKDLGKIKKTGQPK